jgi:hypothetical protein
MDARASPFAAVGGAGGLPAHIALPQDAMNPQLEPPPVLVTLLESPHPKLDDPEYRFLPPDGVSDVWKYMRLTRDRAFAKCVICFGVLSFPTSGATSNLARHLKTKHNLLHRRKKLPPLGTPKPPPLVEHGLTLEDDQGVSHSHQQMQRDGGPTMQRHAEPQTGPAQPALLSVLSLAQPSAPPLRHQSQLQPVAQQSHGKLGPQASGDARDAVTRCLLKYMHTFGLPLRAVISSEFLAVIQASGGAPGLVPSLSELCSAAQMQLARFRARVTRLLREAPLVALSFCSFSTARSRLPLVGAAAHFVDAKFRLRTLALGVAVASEPRAEGRVAGLARAALGELGVAGDKIWAVSFGAASQALAGTMTTECVADALHRAVRHAQEESGLSTLCERVRKLAGYFRTNRSAAEALDEASARFSEPPPPFLPESAHQRWGLTEMLRGFLDNRLAIQIALAGARRDDASSLQAMDAAMWSFSQSDYAAIEDLCAVQNAADKVLRRLEDESAPSAALLAGCLAQLRRVLSERPWTSGPEESRVQAFRASLTRHALAVFSQERSERAQELLLACTALHPGVKVSPVVQLLVAAEDDSRVAVAAHALAKSCEQALRALSLELSAPAALDSEAKLGEFDDEALACHSESVLDGIFSPLQSSVLVLPGSGDAEAVESTRSRHASEHDEPASAREKADVFSQPETLKAVPLRPRKRVAGSCGGSDELESRLKRARDESLASAAENASSSSASAAAAAVGVAGLNCAHAEALVDPEIDLYLRQPRADLDPMADPLPWWYENRHTFPFLARLAQRLLAVPLSSVAAEYALRRGEAAAEDSRAPRNGESLSASFFVAANAWLENE